MTLILSAKQNFHVFCWRLCTNNERSSEFDTTNVFAQKSICWLRRSFTARKIVLSPKSNHELRRGGFLVRCVLLIWFQSEHAWAPVLAASSTASSSSLASQCSRCSGADFVFLQGWFSVMNMRGESTGGSFVLSAQGSLKWLGISVWHGAIVWR